MQYRYVRSRWGAAGLLSLLLGACSEDNPDPYQPLSEACDSCLLEEGSRGCGSAYQACSEFESCEQLVLCELYQQCYLEPPTSDCARLRGCDESIGQAESERAEAFEACARSTCRETCDFVE